MLYEKLKQYGESDFYPFHMPGHKRRMGNFINPYQIDITEIEGFDNLHHAQGILADIEKKLSLMYGSSTSKMLINGSTCGILAAISGCMWTGGRILMARNSHKAAYNAVLLSRCSCAYLYPGFVEEYGIMGGILPEDVEKAFKQYEDIRAVFVTSPTYDGVVSDIKAIAGIAHQYHVPLIVDEAHGAHFQFDKRFPASALHQGADIVINSLHKTLPSLTQTAVMHMQGKFIDKKRIEKYLEIYQSSSPSYLLMASIEICMELLEKEGAWRYEQLFRNLNELYKQMEKNKKIRLADASMIGHDGVYDFDCSKLIFSVCHSSITGVELYNTLLKEYHIQMEMAAKQYVTGIATLADEREGFQRLGDAIAQMEKKITFANSQYCIMDRKHEPECVYTLADTQQKECIRLPLEKCVGNISAEMVYQYPPGIPILVPGERISVDMVKSILESKEMGLQIEGASDVTGDTVLVVKES